MGFNKKFFQTGGIVASTPPAAAGLDPLQNFETVTYTGNGGTQKITGYIRKGAAFNGSSSQIDLNYASLGMGVNDFSYSFWFKLNSTSGSQTFFQVLTEHVNYGLRINDTYNLQSSPTNASGGAQYIGSNVTLDTDWHHVAYVKSSTNGHSLWYDGTKVAEDTNFTGDLQATTDNKTTLGSATNDINWLNGSLDQVRFFNKALSSSEVGELAGEDYSDPKKSTTDYFGDGSGIALYELDEDANDTGGSFGSLVSSPKIDLDVDGYTSGSVSDLSGNGNTATVTGATYGTDPNGGGYFELDGASDYLQISASTDFNSATDFTIEGWFKPDNLTATDHFFSIYDASTNADRKFFVRLNDSDGDLDIVAYNSGGTGQAAALTTSNTSVRVVANKWNHIVLSYTDNGAVVAYINGVAAGSTTATASINTSGSGDLYIGVLNGYIGSYDFDGKVGDIRFYDSALSSSQVLQNFNASKGSYGVGYDGTATNVNFLGMAFQPDLVWIKRRDSGVGNTNHFLFDSIRGAGERLMSNLTNGEITISDELTSFDSNGFTVGSDISANGSGGDHVAWCWKAGGTAVSNTDGTITSSVSANQDAGFSIVSFTSNGAASVVSTGHGLSVEPELVIFKNRDNTSYWLTYHKDVGDNGYLQLHTSDATTSFTPFFDMTSTTIGVRQSSLAANNEKCIAYCFHSVDGYQRISSYSGTTSDNRIYTTDDGTSTGNGGFQPRWVMVKAYGTASLGSMSWGIWDKERGDGGNILYANLSNAEDINTNLDITLNSDGFTVTSSNAYFNTSGQEYIYLAIA